MNTNLVFNSQALKPFALFFLFSLFSLNSYSQNTPQQTPCGDVVAGEITPINATCNMISWSTAGSDDYWDGTDNSCVSTDRDDVWGWFDATATVTTVSYLPDSRDAVLHIFDAGPSGAPTACSPAATPYACSNDFGAGIQEDIVMATVIGNRYRIRVQREGSDFTMTGTLCVFNGGTLPPPNDDCANATTLICGSNLTTETTIGAANLDSAFTGCVMGDVGVWYTFTGDGQQWTIAASGAGSGFDLAMGVLEGNCAGFTAQIDCLDDFFAAGTETSTFTTVIGTIYYVYISDFNDNGTQTGDFTISATCTAPPSVPPNDEPCGAVGLTVNPDYACGVFSPGTLNGATDSGLDVPPGSCAATNGSTTNDDVWYSFVATGTAHSIQLLNVSGGTDMAVAVFGGFIAPDCTVAPNDRIICYDDPDPIFEIVTGLVAGQTYFVQVYSYWAGATATTFDICIGSPPPPPANDDPCGAVGLTVNPDLACGVITSSSVASALNSGINACTGTEDDDVWFSFVATSTSHVVQLSNVAGGAVDMVHGVYGGFIAPDCSVAVGDIIGCSNLNTSTTGGLVIGETYFVQVYTFTGTGGQNTTFDICVGTPPVVANDEPCGAIGLTVNPDFLCGSITSGTVEWATDSGMTTCFGTSDDDVWYSFVATNTAHSIDLLNIAGLTLDMYIGIYGGFPNATGANCVNGTVDANVAACSDFDSNIFTGFVIGETYFVQVYTYTSTGNQTSTFDVCIGTPPPPPANDDPCGAVPLTVGQSCNAVTGSVASALNSGIDACFGTPDDDVWFSFVATNPNHSIDINNIFGTTTDLYHAVYGGFTSPDCSVAVGDLVPGSCSDPNTSQLTGLTIGDTYFIQVFTWTSTSGQTTTFDICVTEPCNNLGPINPIPTVCPLIGAAIGSNPFTATPFDPNPTANIDCSTATVTLEAYTNVNETTSYIVEQISNTLVAADYSPTGFSTPQVIPNDDVWADAFTNIPFNFCFYGSTYGQIIVGSNGAISFDSSITPGSGSGWQFDENLPSIDGALTNQTIYSVFQDLNPFGTSNSIQTWIEGTSVGCRTFNVSFVNIPLFGDSTRFFTGKTVLYETTNVIEIYIQIKEIENGNVGPWNAGNAIVGIQGNSAAGEALTPPCRNALDDNWATSDEAWRFVPSGAAVIPTTYNWFSILSGGASLGTGSTLNVTVPDTYTVQTQITTCGQTVTLTDEIVVSQSSKTWTGALDTNWYEDANWIPALIPTPADCVLIPDTNLAINGGSGRFPIADESNLPIPLPPPTAYALNLTVDTGATLEVLANTELVVTDWIHLDGSIDVRSTGSIIQINDGALNVNNNTGSGVINMERNVSGIGSYDYIYWSTPVESFGVGGVSPGSTHIYEWNPNIAANGIGGFGDWIATTEIMQNGKGYIIRNIVGTPTPLTPVFSGKPNNGIITKAITRGTYNVASPGGDYPGPGSTFATRLDDNWNLVGNPYPSAISATDFILRNASVISDDSAPVTSGAIYLWRHLAIPSNVVTDPFYADFVYNYNPNDYLVYNGSGSSPAGFNGDIAAGQAFFVLMEHSAPRNTTSVRFDNAMRNETLDNSQFYRTERSEAQRIIEGEKHRIWLDLITPTNTANSILVGYIEGATDDQDRMFDANELSETSARFYSLVDNTQLSIQGKALPFEDTDTVSLGIEISQNGNYSIAINTLDGLFLDDSQAIYLEDNYTGIIHDLRVNPYSFNTEVGIYNDRFVLRYNNESLSVDEFDDSNLEIVAPNNSYVKITSGISPISSVTLFDLHGRVLIENRDINNSEFIMQTSNFSEGVYIVKAELVDGKQKQQKVVIKTMR